MNNIHGTGKGKTLIRRVRILVLASVLLCCCCAAAENAPSVMSASIYKTEWQWQAGGFAEFEGNMICENASEEHPLTMRLSVSIVPDGTEGVKDPLFTSVNGTKLTVRKQTGEYKITSSEQAVRFTGRWELPEDFRIDEAAIHLRIYSDSGDLLAESDLRMSNDQVTSGDTGYRFPETGNIIRIIVIAAAAIWIFAIIRIIRNRKRR